MTLATPNDSWLMTDKSISKINHTGWWLSNKYVVEAIVNDRKLVAKELREVGQEGCVDGFVVIHNKNWNQLLAQLEDGEKVTK